MYDEQVMERKAEAAFREYQKDPKAWSAKTEKQTKETWFGFTILYVSLVTIVVIAPFHRRPKLIHGCETNAFNFGCHSVAPQSDLRSIY